MSEVVCPEGHTEPIGIEVRGVYDGVLIWQCQVCDALWPRFADGPRHLAALELIEHWGRMTDE